MNKRVCQFKNHEHKSLKKNKFIEENNHKNVSDGFKHHNFKAE